MTRRLAFITSQVAPFQIEMAEAVNALPGVQYDVIFCRKENARPAYWLDLADRIAARSSTVPNDVPQGGVVDWATERLRQCRPDVVLIGGVRGPWFDAAQAYRRRHNPDAILGQWMEPPLASSKVLHKAVRRADYLRRLKQVDFILSIGDRAHAYYRGCNQNTHFVPYGEDLSVCLAATLPKPRTGKTKFLFSGGLHPRHNFPLIMESFRRLLAARGPCFEFVISGSGPEQSVIDEAVSATPALAAVIRFDREFAQWSDRLRPFVECDVLIYPTQHAGWGLVVPEAMAAGMLVISSRKAESARFLINHEQNGLQVEESVESFLAAITRAIDDPEFVERMGRAARDTSIRGHAPHVAERLMDVIRIATGGRF